MTLKLLTINKVAVMVAAATRHHQALLYTGLLLLFGWLAGSGVTLANYPADVGGGAPALSFCGDAVHRDVSRRLLYVSTLDGTVTALDLSAAGRPRWSLPTSGGAPLLSSSIHRFELTNDGRMVRMIPSLYGGLYKFDGESIEQIPVTADHLLSSSYKFSEDLVISGGKETRSYGVSARTGRIVYECSIAGCRNHTVLDATDEQRHGPPREYDADAEHDPLVDDIVVVRRETQTVRAVEPRTGGERWNFSVGHHQLELLPPPDCRQTRLDGRPRDDAADDEQLELRVLVPEGVVCAVRRDDPRVVVWRHKFDHPIVNAWRVNARDELETVNLFSFQQFPVKQQPQQHDVHPSVYVGMYNRQLYIQESERLKKTMLEDQLDTIQQHFLRIPWKPQYALAAIEGSGAGDENAGTSVATTAASTAVDLHDEDRATALSILYATEYANGNGFFLYTSADLNRTSLCDRPNGTRDGHHHGAEGEADEDESYRFPFADDDTPTKIIIVSLWFWWKEIMVISLTTALILNVVLSRRLITPREVVIVERHVEIQVPVPVASSATAFAEAIDDVSAQSRRSLSESQQSDASTFVSRYQTDFDMLQCLGKGGFGVVFESKNKLDDCRYAIKRIQLPNRPESRDRVMREVKTLAHCEHQNIVRYFQAWVETPPPGWQEAADRIWMDCEAMSHSVDIESPTLDDEETSSMLRQPVQSPKPPKSVVLSKVINRRERGLDTWITNLNTNECLKIDDDNRKTSFVNDDDSSFIQFRNDSASVSAIDCSYCGDSVFQDGDQRGGLNGTAICIEHSVDIVTTDEANLRKPSTTRGRRQPELTNDSFQIVFQTTVSGEVLEWSRGSNESTTEDDDEEEEETTTSGRPASVGYDDDDDSFRIEFKHSTNGGAASVTADSGSGSGDHGQAHRPSATLPAAVRIASVATAAFNKPRTFSENIDSTSCCVDATEDTSFACKASRHSVDAVEPFRRTHRRPLSLDLTAASRARKEVELFSANRMFLYIQMQLCKKQSLKDWLRLNDAQTRRRDIVCIFRQIVDGVEYCHLKGLIHRDLKPSNIFFALDGQIKIGDFGLVTGMSEMPNTPCSRAGGVGGGGAGGGCAKHTQQVGTHLYMSPEQLRGEQYSYKVDVYSLGVIFFELLRVFGTEMERIETLKALRLGVFPRDFACDFHDEHQLLKLMLSQSPDERPTTIGIRARPPLGFTADASTEWHFTLPPRRRDSHISGVSATGDRSSTELSQGL